MPPAKPRQGRRTDLACPECGATTRTIAVWPSREAGAGHRVPIPVGRACTSCGHETHTRPPQQDPSCTHEAREAVVIRGEPPARQWRPYGSRCLTCLKRFPPTDPS